MGSADAVTLHLQQWFLVVGFAGAVAGLLAPRVRTWILLPLLLLLLLMPDLRNRATDLYADTPLGYLLAGSALLVLLWLVDGESWKLWAATLLLGGAMLTKREGILFAACILFAALVASFRERRRAWPRLAAAGLVAFALALRGGSGSPQRTFRATRPKAAISACSITSIASGPRSGW